MKSFIKTFFAVLVANVILVALLFVFVAGLGASMKAGKKPDIKDGSYLVMDIYGEVLAYDPPIAFPESIIGPKPETLHRILSNLEKATVDDRIEGVIIKISTNNGLGSGMIEEIRGAINKLQEAGKLVYAYSDGLDRKALFLAAACDSVFLAPPGYVYYVGYGASAYYIKGLFEKLGLKADLHKIADYKSAAELVTRTDMSPEAREMRTWIMRDLWEMEMAAVSGDLGVTEDKLVECMDYAIFLAEEAQEAGLVDGVLYWSDLKDRLKGEDDEKLKTVGQSAYAKITRESVGLKGKKRIAVVHAHGMIGGRKSEVNPMLGSMMGHETVAANLRKAAEDDKVEAVVFRVDSRGGESLASELIRHAVDEVMKKKPVVVSMIDVAASGGYTISYHANKIVANPMTITGSIGSISGKVNTTGMFNKVGITFDTITLGPNALMWSDRTDFTREQRRRFVDNHWGSFNIWLADVAERRGMTFEEAEQLAHGRVWTGRQAEGNGLVDELGGLDRAIELAKEEAGVEPDEEVTLVHYPKQKGLLASIMSGDSPLSAMVRWALYRFVHEDLADTYRMLTSVAVDTWATETSPPSDENR
jgi:protease-4